MRPLSDRRARLVRRLHDRKLRKRDGRVLVEGPRAIRTALSGGAELEFLVVEDGDRGRDALEALQPPSVPEHLVFGSRDLTDLADTESPQGVLCVVREPSSTLPESAPGRVLVLDRVQDPGNAGTLVRAAAGLGCGLVVALDGTVDPWNPKAVRSSVGEAFRVRVATVDWASFEVWRAGAGIPLLVADAGGTDVRRRRNQGPWALLIGNEARGPRAEAVAAASARIALPLSAGVESFNAAMAGSILMWALGPGRDPVAAPAGDQKNRADSPRGSDANHREQKEYEDG